MVYLVCLIIVCGCGYGGWLLSRKFVNRVKLLKEIKDLAEKLKGNILFNKKAINDVFNEFLNRSEFSDQINKIYELTNGGDSKIVCENKSFDLLSREEKHLLVNFFSELGVSNDGVECEKIDSFLNEIKKLIGEAEEKRKVNEPIYYKLSLAVGVVVSILIF